jgi:hypothetical protein
MLGQSGLARMKWHNGQGQLRCRVAQPCPFDELRRHRIADRCGGAIVFLCLAHQIVRLLLRRDQRQRHLLRQYRSRLWCTTSSVAFLRCDDADLWRAADDLSLWPAADDIFVACSGRRVFVAPR